MKDRGVEFYRWGPLLCALGSLFGVLAGCSNSGSASPSGSSSPAAAVSSGSAGAASGASSPGSSSTTPGTTPAGHVVSLPAGAPVLQSLGVSFGAWNQTTQRAGDFWFQSQESKVFLEFGAVVQGTGGPKVLPTFEYRVHPQCVVRAPCAGVITGVRPQSGGDYELWIQPSPNSEWMVILDHVTQLQVALGDTVQASDPLGSPGPWSASLGRVELQIHHGGTQKDYAPLALFDPGLRASFEQHVWDLMRAWEAFKQDPGLYDEQTMTNYYAGCLAISY